MEELSKKLKAELISQLTRNEQNLNAPYLMRGDKMFTRKTLATEIENETDIGIEILTNILMLAVDLMTRQKLF